INGRYILQPEIFDILARHERGAGNEIQITDAMLRLLATQPFFARPFSGRLYDCGAKAGFIDANDAFAVARADVSSAVLDPLREMVALAEPTEEAAWARHPEGCGVFGYGSRGGMGREAGLVDPAPSRRNGRRPSRLYNGSGNGSPRIPLQEKHRLGHA